MKGKLTVYYGPMFSGKSKQLIIDFQKDKRTKKAIKPKGDLRTKGIYSRSGLEIPARSLDNIDDLAKVSKNYESIYIDEIFLFSGNVKDVILDLLKQGKDVTVAGLDYDYRGEPFKKTTDLIKEADILKSFTAKCHITGKEATWTGKLIQGKVAPYHVDSVIESDLKEKTEVEYIAVNDEIMKKWRREWKV